MGTLIAIEKLNYIKPKPVFISHSRVVELHPEETAEIKAFNDKLQVGIRTGQRGKETKQERKEYKCLDCGTTWFENVHAPLIVTSEQMNTYYAQAQPCSVLK